MCGIAGVLYSEGSGQAQKHLLEQMVGALAHRGPDGQGYHIDPIDAACGLGHRRLAIIDLDGGAQPLTNEDKTVWMVYNGEIYNFHQLRKELQGQGHTFTTACDTEVIVHLYEQYGTNCVQKLRGMFAFALWDQSQRKLLLARDRIGQKPLYYHYDGQRLLFASELKALLQVPALPRELDPEALDNYLTLGYVPAPGCILRGFSKLPPACTLSLQADKGSTQPQPQPYWQLPETCDYPGNYDQAKERLRTLLTEAAVMQTIADVPLGVLLSGGIDSSIVTALLAQESGSPLRTFTINFDDPKFSEARYARLVAEKYNTEHHELYLKPSCLDVLDTIIEQFDEPFADSSAIPTYQVCQLARQHVTVALTGDGGDESFLGYQR
jgi:asparagine synthase (glutamine-hydrolysing)